MGGCWRGSVAVGLSLGLRLPWVWWRFVNLMVEVFSFFDLHLLCVDFGCVTLFGCKVINGNGNKTIKMNSVSKRPKQVQAILKNGMGPTKKTNSFFRLKLEISVPNKLKFSGTPVFWFTNKKTVFKMGISNKPELFEFSLKK